MDSEQGPESSSAWENSVIWDTDPAANFQNQFTISGEVTTSDLSSTAPLGLLKYVISGLVNPLLKYLISKIQVIITYLEWHFSIIQLELIVLTTGIDIYIFTRDLEGQVIDMFGNQENLILRIQIIEIDGLNLK